MDISTTLCLACSSSLPPHKSTSGSSSKDNSIYITKCCSRPICPSCIASNPRLARYYPCLACLGGVDVIASSSSNSIPAGAKGKAVLSPGLNLNLDGSLRDEDTFVLGEDEDDYDDIDKDNAELSSAMASSPPPPYETSSNPLLNVDSNAKLSTIVKDTTLTRGSSARVSPVLEDADKAVVSSARQSPYKYYLDKRDTLQGIALRFGLDVFEICRLNNLPPSVLRTTPHLLHTRAFLLLPANAKPHPSLMLDKVELQGREEKLVREQAGRKLQTLTKEVDWRVAKAYVTLADDPQEQDAYVFKRKETGTSSAMQNAGRMLEALAIERYLEDEEWEAKERRAGRGPHILALPFEGRKQAI